MVPWCYFISFFAYLLIREKLGIDIVEGQILTSYPREEILKGLTQIFEDLGRGVYTVSALKLIDQRLMYIDGFASEQLPNPSIKLPQRFPLELAPSITEVTQPASMTNDPGFTETPGLGGTATLSTGTLDNTDGASHTDSQPNLGLPSSVLPGSTGTASSSSPSTSRRSPIRARSTLIPRTCTLQIPHHRIHSIYTELKRLNIDDNPNAGAVMLRVFLELSLDYLIEQRLTWPKQQRNHSTLAMKLNAVATYMEQNEVLTTDELEPVRKAAAGQTLLASAVRTMHGYVHSRHYSPVGTELLNKIPLIPQQQGCDRLNGRWVGLESYARAN